MTPPPIRPSFAASRRFGGPQPGSGRPRAPSPRATISIWVDARDHDEIVKRARAAGLSVSGYSRALLLRGLRAPR